MSAGPVTLITGAGSGIGRALARLLAQRGHRLLLVARTRGALEETLRLCKEASPPPAGSAPRACITECDMADPAQARRLVERARRAFGALDNVVNCAGTAPLVPIAQTDDRLLLDTFRVNTLGPAALIAAAWPHFLERRAGCVVNVSTVGTRDPFPGFFAYAASKSALDSLTRSCHVEGATHGIRAFSVNPGAVETPMLRAIFPPAQVPPEHTLAPEDVAEVIAACIAGERDTERGRSIFVERM